MPTNGGSESDLVLFVERANESWRAARLRRWSAGAGAKASLKGASESRAMDPKPGDLPMRRPKRE